MGLIKAGTGAIGGALGEQWLEVFEADNMTDQTVMTKGVPIRRDSRSSNTQGTSNIISNGSMIHVYPNQFMMLVENGRIIDYTAEPGTYKVDNSSSPSLFNGQFGEALKDVWERFKFGGTTPQKQIAVYINLQEIKGIKFGTKNPIQYFDNFYNAELFLRAFGDYSVQIVDPILFYGQVVDKSKDRQEINEINEQYMSEFLNALTASMNTMSVDGHRISHVTSKSRDLAVYMRDTLDEEWRRDRGFQIMNVGIASITYDDESKELIGMRSKGAMLSDPMVREGYVQGNISEGFKAAGSNEAGAGQTFMGLGMGMNAGGGFMGQASANNTEQYRMQQEERQRQQAAAGAGSNQNEWFCTDCGQKNAGGKFCSNCGTKRLASDENACGNCGWKIPEGAEPKFCPNCGNNLSE